MKYFSYIDNPTPIFYKEPCTFDLYSGKDILSHALGATLYMGADRPTLLKDILYTKACSVVVCLEDSVPSDKLKQAESNVFQLFQQIDQFAASDKTIFQRLPLIFLRIRSLVQLKLYLANASLTGLCGFILPKFSSVDGVEFFSNIQAYNERYKKCIYGMPILETPEVIFKETRISELSKIKGILDCYKNLVLNIRIGGTDLSGIYSLRRGKDFTIYDLTVINDCISDIINFFRRDDYIISAPVNEYFNIDADLDTSALVREIKLDRLNGLIGKTVIHPSQVNIVNSLMIITKEEYLDAEAIVNSSSDGVIKSTYSNKMNEVKPHLKWAYKIILLSKIMGVLNDGKTYKDILELSGQNTNLPRPHGVIMHT